MKLLLLICVFIHFSVLAQAQEQGLALTPKQLAAAGIETQVIRPKVAEYFRYAPGEVTVNEYQSYLVSPRLTSVIVSRHVALGDHVTKGMPLVTLFSAELAGAQGDYRAAQSDWERVQKLGKRAVGERRYVEALNRYDSAQGKLLAYGMDPIDIKALQSGQLGRYLLRSNISGVVLADDFQQGQTVAPGQRLFLIADEKELWVQAKLAGTSRFALPLGTRADIASDKQRWPAVVSQAGHTLDPITRTRTVRLTLNNEAHQFHAGMYVDVYFRFQTTSPVMVVPPQALMRGSDGDWTLFVEMSPGVFVPREVELGQPMGDQQQVIGLPPETVVAVKGAFYIASEIAKSGFSVHNH